MTIQNPIFSTSFRDARPHVNIFIIFAGWT